VTNKFEAALRCFEAGALGPETFDIEATQLFTGVAGEKELLGNFKVFLLVRLRYQCQAFEERMEQLEQLLMAPEFQRPPLAPRKRKLEPGFDVGDVVELCRKIDQGRQRAIGIVQVAKLSSATVVTKLTCTGGTRYKEGREYRFQKSELRVVQKRAKHVQ
jgi:hypothetical protein